MKKILIVDDSDVIRVELSTFLKSAGYEVLEANGGAKGLEVANANEGVSCVISDYNMPDLNGVQMIAKIKENLKYAATHFLMLTTESSTELKKQGQDVGVRAWLVKPLNTEMLKKVLEKLLT